MCRLSLAWVTSENSTMLLGSDILRLFFTGPYLVSSPLCSVSGVDCPSVDPRQLPLLLSDYQLTLWSPATNCLSLGRVVNSHSPPRTTSGYGEISCPRILCLVSRQNRQLNRLLWQPTPIVLQTKLNTLTVPGREFDDFTLRIVSSIGELLLLLYKSGFYRRE